MRWTALAKAGRAALAGALVALAAPPSGPGTLSSSTRLRIYALVRRSRGVQVGELARELGLAWGAVQYHLEKLEAAGLVRTRMVGRRRFAFPPDAVVDEAAQERALLQERTCREVARLVAQRPRVGVSALAALAGVSPRTVYYHLKRLREAGLVDASSEGYHDLVATPALLRLLEAR